MYVSFEEISFRKHIFSTMEYWTKSSVRLNLDIKKYKFI